MKKQKKIPLVVSIDFDFFIENDPMLDMGHREEGIFLNTMWAIRQAEWMAIRGKTAREMMPMRERPEDFVGQLRALLDIPFGLPAFAAESHAMLPKALDMAGIARCDIVNFDAHHDIAYGQCPVSEYSLQTHTESPIPSRTYMAYLDHQRREEVKRQKSAGDYLNLSAPRTPTYASS